MEGLHAICLMNIQYFSHAMGALLEWFFFMWFALILYYKICFEKKHFLMQFMYLTKISIDFWQKC